QEGRILRVLPGVAPGADVEAGVPGEVLAVHRAVLEVWSVAVEASCPLVRDLVLPQAESELAALLGRESKAAVPQDPGSSKLVHHLVPGADGLIQHHVPAKVLSPRQEAG